MRARGCYLRDHEVTPLLYRHFLLDGFRVGERGVFEDDTADEDHEEAEAASNRQEVVHWLLVRLEMELHQQVHGAHDRTSDDLRDRAGLEGDKEADEEELAPHLHELPPEALNVVLAVEEADGARKRCGPARCDRL